MTSQEDNATIQVERLEEDFTTLSRLLLQDPDISADAQMVATFLLSLPKFKKNGKPWDINPRHVWKSKNIGRDRVYKAFEELGKLGYMLKQEKRRGNLKGEVSYKISNFKKYLRNPESQEPEAPEPESQYYKKKELKKEREEKESTTSPPEEKPKPKEDSSSFFCKEKEELLKDLPINESTRSRLMKFKLELLKKAVAATKEAQPDKFGGYLYSLCIDPKSLEGLDYSTADENKAVAVKAFGNGRRTKNENAITISIEPLNTYLEITVNGLKSKIFKYDDRAFKAMVNKELERIGVNYKI